MFSLVQLPKKFKELEVIPIQADRYVFPLVQLPKKFKATTNASETLEVEAGFH